MIDKKIDDKQGMDVRKSYNHYLDKRKELLMNTWFRIEGLFVDKITKDSILLEQLTKLNKFWPKQCD